MPDFRLRYIIDADGSKAKSELKSVDEHIARLGGSISQSAGLSATQMNALAIGAGVAATGILAIGAAAVTTTRYLFDLTKQAADYGSAIFDATEITGLHAESLSAMDFAAKQSGASMEQITSGIAKFAKQVGAAVDGSEKAAAALEDLGIKPQEAMNDLDAALGKVFKRIADAKPGIEQITLAQKAFGKSGADLLPFIKSFDGDLAGLVKRAKELGVTIDDEAARAADAFGDQLDTLNAQFAAVGRTIGQAFMPIFMDMAKSTSDWVAKNQGQIKSWGQTWADATRGVIANLQDVKNWLDRNDIHVRQPMSADPFNMVANLFDAAAARGAQIRQAQTVPKAFDYSRPQDYHKPKPGQYSADDFAKDQKKVADDQKHAAEQALREAERAERERVSFIKEMGSIEVSEKQASIETLIQLEEQRFEEGLLSEQQYVDAVRTHERDLAAAVIDSLARTLGAVRNHADEKRRIESEIKILNDRREQQESKYATEDAKRKKKQIEDERALHDVRIKSWNAFIEKMQDAMQMQNDSIDLQRKLTDEARKAAIDAASITAPGKLGGGIARGLGIDLITIFDPNSIGQIKTGAQMIKDVYADMRDFAGVAIGDMVNGLVQMGVAWLTTGEFSAQAALQMLASTAFSIATQAGLKAIFEYAEGLAALGVTWGVPNPSSIAHFAAAATYGSIAAIAGVAGVGLALGARAAGGGGGSRSGRSGSSSASGSGSSSSRSTTPISRVSDDAFVSGRSGEGPLIALAREIAELHKKIHGMRPGDVLVAGARQQKGFIGRQVSEDIKSNSSLGVAIKRASGDR